MEHFQQLVLSKRSLRKRYHSRAPVEGNEKFNQRAKIGKIAENQASRVEFDLWSRFGLFLGRKLTRCPLVGRFQYAVVLEESHRKRCRETGIPVVAGEELN